MPSPAGSSRGRNPARRRFSATQDRPHPAADARRASPSCLAVGEAGMAGWAKAPRDALRPVAAKMDRAFDRAFMGTLAACRAHRRTALKTTCLLYTSDAADE